jgi:hypothetical protein
MAFKLRAGIIADTMAHDSRLLEWGNTRTAEKRLSKLSVPRQPTGFPQSDRFERRF